MLQAKKNNQKGCYDELAMKKISWLFKEKDSGIDKMVLK